MHFRATCKAVHIIADQTQHHFRSLSSLKDEINSYLQIPLKATTEKIDKLYKVDKDIWRELDDQEQTCEKLVKQIRKLRKERVSLKSFGIKCFLLTFDFYNNFDNT